MAKKILLITAIFALLYSSCKNEEENNEKNNSSFRKGDLFSEDFKLDEKSVNDANAPGTNYTFQRAFENAPPVIPHKTDGFFPITIKNNICLTCHMPKLAPTVGAVPIPESHFTNLRPEIKKVGAKYVLYDEENSVSFEDLKGNLNTAMYNCDQCHVPMTNATLVVRNTFDPEFRNDSNKNSSDLIDKMDEGVK